MHEHILIVDDEPNVCLNYRLSLEAEGYEISEARSAAQALELLADSSFALVILDLRMPGMDGLELLGKMRQNAIRIPAVIVTAYSEVSLAVKAMKLGAIDFLEKTLRPEALRKIVAETLNRYPQKEDPPVDTFAAHIKAARRCLNLHSFAKAKLHLAKAIEQNPKSAEAFNLAGVLTEVLEDYNRAKKNYGQAIRLNKNYEPAQQNMRRLFEVDHFGSSNELVNLGDE